MFTICFLSYHSKHLLEDNIEKIISYNLNCPILIIENSGDYAVKDYWEKNGRGLVKVFLSKENLGFSKGMNKAVELSDTKFVFLNPADVILSKECIVNLKECVNSFSDFILLAPTYEDETIFKNYDTFLFSKEKKNVKTLSILNKFILKEVDFIDGTFIVNKEQLDNSKIMDEKIFIYFETMDMCLNFKKNLKKMYIIDNIKFTHLGGQSHIKKYDFNMNLSRNWHYNWSKFYYFKKNFGYFFALKKMWKILIKYLIKLIFFKIKNNNKEFLLKKMEFLGLLNSILLKKSSYRPNIEKINNL